MEKSIIKSTAKYVRITPRKARLVTDMVRGMNALDAVTILKFTEKKAALHVRKCLESAIANAENNNSMDKSKLMIVEARVDEAPMLKRGIAVSRGRYHQILKRNSHIVIGLSDTFVKKVDKKAVTKSERVVESESEKKEIDAIVDKKVSKEKVSEKKVVKKTTKKSVSK